MTPYRPLRSPFVVAVTLLLAIPCVAAAQVTFDPNGGGPGAGGHGRHGGGHRQRGNPGAAPVQGPQLKRDPAQRLDPGAVLCRTEADLQQHQAAISARLDGKDTADAAGCHLVRTMTAVAVVERHGQASTEVRLPGPPEQVGWTDAAVRDGLPVTH